MSIGKTGILGLLDSSFDEKKDFRKFLWMELGV
jgi:hypothetical protein